MSKIKFDRHPRSIVRKRLDHPSSLFVTIPAKTVKQWGLKAGEIVEMCYVTEGNDAYVKLVKVSDW